MILSLVIPIAMAVASPTETDLSDFRGDRKPAILEEFSSIEAEPVDFDLDLSKEAAPPQTELTTASDIEQADAPSVFQRNF